MRLEVDLSAGDAASAIAALRLRFVLSRFAAAVVRATLRTVACAPGRVQMRAEVRLVGGAAVSLTAEDEASVVAMVHFIDRLGRAVARRTACPGGPRG